MAVPVEKGFLPYPARLFLFFLLSLENVLPLAANSITFERDICVVWKAYKSF